MGGFDITLLSAVPAFSGAPVYGMSFLLSLTPYSLGPKNLNLRERTNNDRSLIIYDWLTWLFPGPPNLRSFCLRFLARPHWRHICVGAGRASAKAYQTTCVGIAGFLIHSGSLITLANRNCKYDESNVPELSRIPCHVECANHVTLA